MDATTTSPKPQPTNAFLALLAFCWHLLHGAAAAFRLGYQATMARIGRAADAKGWRRDQAAVMGLPNFVGIIMTILGGILAAVVAMIVLNQMVNPFFDNFTAFLTTLAGVSTGNGIADGIIAVLIIVFAIVGPLSFLGIGIAAITIKRRGGT